MKAHQPGSEPIQIPEQIPNPVVRPRVKPTPEQRPVRKEPVEVPEKAPADNETKPMTASRSFADLKTIRLEAKLAPTPARCRSSRHEQ